MSNSWRGPKSEPATPLPRAQDEPASAPAAKDIKAAASPKPVAPEPVVKARPAEKPQPTPDARRKRDTPTPPPAPKRGFDVPKVMQAISKGVAWIGGVTLDAATVVRERSRPLIKRVRPWFTRGREGQLPRQTVVVGFAGLVVVLMTILWINRDGSVHTPALNLPTVPVTDSNLDALQKVEPQPVQPLNRNPAHARTSQPSKQVVTPVVGLDGQPRPKLSRLAIDPREKGKRYYTLATYSVTKEQYLMPLLEYLWSQGVEAAAINGHNSGFFQVVALQGFSREEINQKAHKQYEDVLRRIGRKWKAEGGGDDNLQGLYLQEYAGAQAKLSITKAN